MATYGNQTLNFLRDMNPQGDKEATGLVTRFTLAAIPAPAQLPVTLRLLSQTDVVKILSNAFLEDFKMDDLKPMGSEAVKALFDELEAAAGPGPAGGLLIDDIEEMRDYFAAYFRTNSLLAELGSAYWARAATVIPRLRPAQRARAFAPLWNNTQALTAVAAVLMEALEQLGYSETAFCALDALMPREQGILNADTVFAVAEGGRGLVRVAGQSGMSAELDRSQLAALVAELTVPLATKPWDFFEHTDLLDFPGARSREVIRSVSFLDEPGRLGRVFLRGKVAYLFQRYNAEQEIAAMLLCVGPSNQDVQTLPEMVAGWIDQTIGPKPKARAVQRNSLFVVLTKFDSEFIEKEGEDVVSGQRWTTRLQASLLDFFGKAYEWPQNWDGRPFSNVQWLRSTSVRFSAVYDYQEAEGDTPWQEVRAKRAEAFLAPRRLAFLANDSVRAHFAEPEAAWDAGLQANDGGISYLANRLRPVCDPALKAEQIDGRLAELAADIDGQLRPLYHDGDLAEELVRVRAKSRDLVKDLVACSQAQRFGALIRALQVTPDQVASVYWRQQSEVDEEPIPIGAVNDEDEYGDLGDLLDTPPPTATRALDRFERLADLALQDWTRGMQSFAESADVESVYRLARDKVSVLVGEVARAARRTGLRAKVARALHAQAGYQQRGAAAAQKPTIVIEQMVNEFVHMLGFGELAPERRPSLPNGSRTIFAARPAVQGLPPIGPKPMPYDGRFHVDWMTAVARTMEDNVQDAASGPIDVARNERLGRILAGLGASA